MRIAKINNQRYRRFREKTMALYQVEYITGEMVELGHDEILTFCANDLIDRFAERLRARHAFNKKLYTIETFTEYEIDFHRYRVGVTQILIPKWLLRKDPKCTITNPAN